MTTPISLPPAFSGLDPLAAIWALPTEDARTALRLAATKDELQSLYNGVLPQLDEILAYLDTFKLGHFPPDALCLFRLALAFVEVAPHAELYKGNNQVPYSFDNSRFKAQHGAEIQG
jgi:hypothetical protein